MRLSLIFFAFCCIISCKKKNPITLYITDDRIKTAATINIGSYFVYEDSVTNKTDSFWVSDLSHSNLFVGNDNTSYEYVSCLIHSSYNMYSSVIVVGRRANTMNKILGQIRFGLDDFFDLNLMTLPFTENTTEMNGYIIWRYIKHHESMVIKGTTYKDVYETQTLNPDDFNKSNCYSFFSTEHGLIKLTASTDTSYHVWNLIRSNIIR